MYTWQFWNEGFVWANVQCTFILWAIWKSDHYIRYLYRRIPKILENKFFPLLLFKLCVHWIMKIVLFLHLFCSACRRPPRNSLVTLVGSIWIGQPDYAAHQMSNIGTYIIGCLFPINALKYFMVSFDFTEDGNTHKNAFQFD